MAVGDQFLGVLVAQLAGVEATTLGDTQALFEQRRRKTLRQP